jgi:acyl dehydratase
VCLLLESLAQCGGVAVLADPKYTGRLPLFGGVEHARFRRQVVPGDVVLLETEMTHLSARGGKGHGRASVEGKLAVEADLLFILADVVVKVATWNVNSLTARFGRVEAWLAVEVPTSSSSKRPNRTT